MLRINEMSGSTVGIWTDGQPTASQLTRLCKELKRRIAKAGTIRLLVRIKSSSAWKAEALLDLIGLSRELGRGLERLAVVGQMCKDCTHQFVELLYAKMAFFESARLGEAWKWVSCCRDDAPEAPHSHVEDPQSERLEVVDSLHGEVDADLRPV